MIPNILCEGSNLPTTEEIDYILNRLRKEEFNIVYREKNFRTSVRFGYTYDIFREIMTE